MTENNDDNPIYLVTGDDGTPIGTFDLSMIQDEGCKLAFALAAVCNEREAIARVQEEFLTRVGTDSFGYIAGSALGVMTEHILGPAFEVAAAHGTDLRAGMRAINEGRDPNA